MLFSFYTVQYTVLFTSLLHCKTCTKKENCLMLSCKAIKIPFLGLLFFYVPAKRTKCTCHAKTANLDLTGCGRCLQVFTSALFHVVLR